MRVHCCARELARVTRNDSLAVWGAEDVLVPAGTSRAAFREARARLQQPGDRVLFIEGASHTLHVPGFRGLLAGAGLRNRPVHLRQSVHLAARNARTANLCQWLAAVGHRAGAALRRARRTRRGARGWSPQHVGAVLRLRGVRATECVDLERHPARAPQQWWLRAGGAGLEPPRHRSTGAARGVARTGSHAAGSARDSRRNAAGERRRSMSARAAPTDGGR